MKKTLFIFMGTLAVCSFFTSCITKKELGRVNMISTRNVTPGSSKYKLLASYVGESDEELKKIAAPNFEESINLVVRNNPGGEFLTNVKFWKVHIPFHPQQRYAVSGDVYGVAGKDGKVERSHRGFAPNDVVTWKGGFGYKTGTIKTLVDDKHCIVQKKSGRLVRKKYSKLAK